MAEIVIVGAGDCGARTAKALRAGGFDGRLVLIGDEHEAPYERPPLSKSVLADDASPPPVIATVETLADLEIEFLSGRSVNEIDRDARSVQLNDGTAHSYSQLLLATGARARQAAVPGFHGPILTLRSIADAERLRDQLNPHGRVLVIGGGFIGLEVAATAALRGCAVTVVEFAHRAMSRVVPAPVADVMIQRHRDEGVDVRCGVAVVSIAGKRNGFEAILTDGTSVATDLVIGAVGAVPNTELAAAAGLPIENGIRVDEYLRSADPAIFAAGDCCSFPHPLYGGRRVRIEAWRNALDHADVAARNLMGDVTTCSTVPWFWSDQYELTLQIAGLHAEAAHDVVRSRNGGGGEIRFGLDHDGRVVAASGVGVATELGKDIRLAERLVAQRATPNAAILADPAVPLRELITQD